MGTRRQGIVCLQHAGLLTLGVGESIGLYYTGLVFVDQLLGIVKRVFNAKLADHNLIIGIVEPDDREVETTIFAGDLLGEGRHRGAS